MHDVTATETAEGFSLTAPRSQTYSYVDVHPAIADTDVRLYAAEVVTILDQPFPRQITTVAAGALTLQWTTPEEALDWLSEVHDRIAALVAGVEQAAA